jgi:hypothetical protein
MQSIKVYPNPVSTQITIEYKNEEEGTFTLYNTLGQKVVAASLEKNNQRVVLPITNLVNGVYHYQIQFTNGILQNGSLSISN